MNAVDAIAALADQDEPSPMRRGEGESHSLGITTPQASDEPVVLDSPGATVGIEVPGRAVDAVVVADRIVYPNVAEDMSVVVQNSGDGGVQMLTVLESGSSPSEQRFELELPDDAVPQLNPDGSVSIWLDGVEVGLFERPWATDASGTDLRTHYSLEGNVLVRKTDVTKASFPVVVDPAYYADCGRVTCTRWVSVEATRRLYEKRFNSTTSYWALAHSAKCAISVIGGPLVGAGCAVFSAILLHDLVGNLEYAGQHRRCLVVKYSRQLGFAFPVDYSTTAPARTKKCRRS
jgi:hypothetical protein